MHDFSLRLDLIDTHKPKFMHLHTYERSYVVFLKVCMYAYVFVVVLCSATLRFNLYTFPYIHIYVKINKCARMYAALYEL